MPGFRTERQTVAVKLHSAPGTDPVPTVAANAVPVISPAMADNLALLEPGVVQRALDRAARGTGGGQRQFTGGAILKGSGVAGTAPRYGAFLRGCGMSQATIASAIAGTAQEGGDDTITLATGAISTDDEVNGAVITITGGTGAGQSRPIADCVASTQVVTVGFDWATNPDNTSTYSIGAGQIYQPASSSLETVAIYNWLHNSNTDEDDTLYKMLDAAGNARFTFPTGQLPRVDFTFTGRVSAVTDVTDPGVATYDTGNDLPVLSASTFLGATAIKQETWSLDLGNDVRAAPDPSDAYGVDAAAIVARRTSGRVVPPRAEVATRDALAAWIAGTETTLWHQVGSSAGHRYSVWVPRVRYTGAERADVNGFAYEGIPFDTVGEDTGVYLFIY